MTEPVFGDTTERLYARLPDIYRREDANQSWQFKKYLSGAVDQASDIDTLIERFSFTPPEDGVADDTSDLVDPATADQEWLPWLAQLVGVKLVPSDTVAQWRTRIASTLTSAQPGTVAAMAEAARKVLTGNQTVSIYPFSNGSGVGAGNQWEMLIVTVADETLSDPIAAVVGAGQKPAGVKLYHTTYGASWSTIQTEFPTWADWNGKTWQEIQEAGM